MRKIVIAIDGHSSSGKSTMAKELARTIGYVYVDSGAMYRAVTLYALKHGYAGDGRVDEEALKADMDDIRISFRYNQEKGKSDTFLNGIDVEDEIRSMEVAANVSQIASLAFVRRAMVAQQQTMGESKGIVMDGRDIGTVVFPDAELKVFVTASPEVRAMRRFKELQAKGKNVNYDEILENVRKRDYLDSTREESPLRQAGDALVLDNSEMSTVEQMEWLKEKYQERVKE